MARILKQVAICYSRGSSQLRDGTHFSASTELAGGFFTIMPLREPHKVPISRHEKQVTFHEKKRRRGWQVWRE